MTERLYLDDPALRAATARVVALRPAGVVLDRVLKIENKGRQDRRISVALEGEA